MRTPKILKGMGCACAGAVAAVLVAAPAFAQFVIPYYKSNLSLTCKEDEQTADGSRLLPVTRTGNREFIALCNGLDPDDSADKDAINAAVEAQAVVFDPADHRLLVIDRCSEAQICNWHLSPEHDEACSRARTGTPQQGTEIDYCVYEISDVEDPEQMSLANIHGAAWCKESETWNHVGGANEHTFVNSCTGFFGLFDFLGEHDTGTPCQMEISSSRRFTPSCDPM